MSIQPFIIERSVGHIKYVNEAVLGEVFEKKSITIDYDFPGAKNYGRVSQTTDLGRIVRNSVFYRQEVSPYKYRPFVLITICGVSGNVLTVRTADLPKLITWDTENVDCVQYTSEFLRFWDDSAKAFMSGTNDENRYISSITYSSGATNSTITMSGSLSTSIQVGVDKVGIGAGLENLYEYVIVDEEVDLRDDAKPKKIETDVHTSALYRCRVEAVKISQWRDMSDNFKEQLKVQHPRIFWDVL